MESNNSQIRAEQLSRLMQYYFGTDEPSEVGQVLSDIKREAMARNLYEQAQQKKNLSDINARAEQIEKSAAELSADGSVNLDEMAENPQFVRYLANNGLSAKDAYYLVSRENLEKENLQKAREELTASILAKQDRICENAAIGKSAHKRSKKSARDLTEEEMDEIVRRVRGGEKISF